MGRWGRRPPKERYDSFTMDDLNKDHPLWKSAAFLGLGGYRCRGSKMFADSSVYRSHGTLTNMDPATDWVWDVTLNRYTTKFAATTESVVIPSCLTITDEPFTLAGWIRGDAAPSYQYGAAIVGKNAEYILGVERAYSGSSRNAVVFASYDPGVGWRQILVFNDWTVGTWQHLLAIDVQLQKIF